MTENLTLMRTARKVLEPNWTMAVLVTLVYLIITGIIGSFQGDQSLISTVLGLLISGPLALGFSIFALNISRDNSPDFSNLFEGFNQYGRGVLAYLIVGLLVVVGLVLLIIPGVIVAIGLSMTLFIIADEPNLSVTDAIQKSWKMMNGYKTKYFRLILRFIPWVFLSIILLFVGFLFVAPWIQVTTAKFYDEIKNENFSAEN